MPAVPEAHLTDGEVRLEPWREEHLAFVEAAVAEDAIVRFSHLPAPFDAAAVRRWYDEMPRERRDGTALRLRIADARDGSSLGAIALVDIDRAARRAELGYWLSRDARGRGAAARAVRLMTRWALETLGLTEVEAIVDAPNEASLRVLERCGFAPAPARAGQRGGAVRYVARAGASGPVIGP